MHISKQNNYSISTKTSTEVCSIAQIKESLQKAKDAVSANSYNLFLINSARIKKDNISLIIAALTDLENSKNITSSYESIEDNHVKEILSEIIKLKCNNLNNLNNLIKNYLGKHRLSFFQYIKPTNSIQAYEKELKNKNISYNKLNNLIDDLEPANCNNVDAQEFNNLFKEVKNNLYPNNITTATPVTDKLLERFVDKLVSNPDITMKMIKQFIQHFTPEMFIKSLKQIQLKNSDFCFDFSGWELKGLTFNKDCELDLSKLKFSNTSLKDITFSVDLVNISFDQSVLDNIKFLSNTLSNVNFKNCIFKKTTYEDVIFINSNEYDNQHFEFEYSTLKNVLFKDCKFNNTSYKDVKFITDNIYDIYVDFKTSIINDNTFINCDMHGVCFTESTLDNVDFRKCQLHNVSFLGSKLIDTVYNIINENKNENQYNYLCIQSLSLLTNEFLAEDGMKEAITKNEKEAIQVALEIEALWINLLEEPELVTTDTLNNNELIIRDYKEKIDQSSYELENNVINNISNTENNLIKTDEEELTKDTDNEVININSQKMIEQINEPQKDVVNTIQNVETNPMLENEKIIIIKRKNIPKQLDQQIDVLESNVLENVNNTKNTKLDAFTKSISAKIDSIVNFFKKK